ncbi:uncharacterized protein TDEL_0D03690 [Torulaspora delbrueckii]|uniref:DNA-binding protein REB1 n=1 Tax=Torulaspora delbrueckii TaxID=4950 RepID=G8ZTK9_TORDE|nr:hypothetical protein TDEL_0D03690 [Torulaspora delbrueckii]CCE91953.1 hypothetical protein TDEL_0D03690 [Torulaspora delbrueckii]
MAGEQEKRSRDHSPFVVHHQDVGNGNHESVEEAVFKYVGVGLQHDDDHKGKKSGEVHDGGSKGPADMEWLFRHAQGVDDETGQDSSSARERQSVALAAVAAAYASGGGGLGKRGLEKVDDDDENIARGALKRARKAKEEKAKLQLAVDPELATLDDSGVSEHDQLVRKAIIDTDSIAQHPDFQQYLNTEVHGHKLKGSQKLRDKSDDSDGEGKGLEDVDPSVVAASAANHDDELGDVTKQYSELQKESAIDGPVTKSLQKKDYREVLPKVMSSSQISVDTDVSHLISSAASKASAIIGTTTQSSGKSFDSAEEAALEQFITEYQTIKNLDRQQICERIWSNERRKDDFWSNMCKVLPYRSRSSIYKHVRRKYHIFEQRGKWTPQEDQELARLCVEKEGQWSEVGKAMGRMPEDCRDRWRNYVKCGSSRASNKWAPDEEELLKRVIAEMLEEAERNYLARNSNELVHDSDGENESGEDNKSDVLHGGKDRKLQNKPSFKDAINWTIVSERMGGTRSRIQCRYKWNKLVKKEAIAKIQSIGEGDKRWILEKLRDLGFTEDSQVDWEELAALKPGVKWTGTELKLCYERMRSGIRYYKQKSINEISKELLGLLDGSIPLDSKGN